MEKALQAVFLASALNSLKFKTAHYTSPHILNFNERIWLNGNDVSSEALELAHIELQKLTHRRRVKCSELF